MLSGKAKQRKELDSLKEKFRQNTAIRHTAQCAFFSWFGVRELHIVSFLTLPRRELKLLLELLRYHPSTIVPPKHRS